MANNLILDRLVGVKKRFVEVGELLTSPDVMSDMKRYIKLNKEYKELKPVVEAYEKYKSAIDNLDSARELLSAEKDEEMREMAKAEIDTLLQALPEMEEDIRYLLLPADPEDEKNAVMEIRAGTGGDEASIFAGDLFRMYSKYIEAQGWKIDMNYYTEGTAGGYKEIVFNVIGDGVYGILKYESGVHRVQRVPQTETQGRIHTSAATVAVLPEAGEYPQGHILLIWPRRTERQHHIFSHQADTYPYRGGGDMPGREISDQEPRKGNEGASHPPL